MRPRPANKVMTLIPLMTLVRPGALKKYSAGAAKRKTTAKAKVDVAIVIQNAVLYSIGVLDGFRIIQCAMPSRMIGRSVCKTMKLMLIRPKSSGEMKRAITAKTARDKIWVPMDSNEIQIAPDAACAFKPALARGAASPNSLELCIVTIIGAPKPDWSIGFLAFRKACEFRVLKTKR